MPGMNSGLSPSDPTLAPTAASAAAGQWAPLVTLKALAASAPGRECGLRGVTAVSFSPDENPIAAEGCTRPGVARVFTGAGGTWRPAGLGEVAADRRADPGRLFGVGRP